METVICEFLKRDKHSQRFTNVKIRCEGPVTVVTQLSA